MNRVSEFMASLSRDLIEKKGVTESTAALYIKNLWTLNDKKEFKNLSFLRNISAIDEILNKYADTTRKTFLATIVSVLSLMADKPTYKKVYQHYYDAMMKYGGIVNAVEKTGQKSEKQEENWISWEKILEIKKAMVDEIDKIKSKVISEKQYNTLLNYMVLSLYTDIAPRRNADYSNMYVVGKWDDKMDDNKNYLDLATKTFIFNKYKTQKKYGSQIVAIPDSLWNVITLYLKHHPSNHFFKTNPIKPLKKHLEFKFLVYANGAPLVAVNAITRILNKIFGLKIGSSMMRHIYLSSKYGDIKEEQMKDALAMGHSVAEQQGVYVKS